MKTRALRAGLISGLCAAALLSTSGCSIFIPQYGLTIREAVVDAEYTGPDYASDPVEITESACGEEIDCLEAWSTDQADYYRFATRDEAAEFADGLADGAQSNFIVMDFAGKAGVDRSDQEAASCQLRGTHFDHEGPCID
ncbi:MULTISPECIES: hypothetical protein [unclassified Pseudoclavibacter]|uniref:hypothetical protein n=1 Tax=unclassified Pseudoclavibacter TaxID=2615177 RepID=UPI000CE74E7A|nr:MULTISPECIES: hypothetical protein [unclassified Pseudoclavibacter]PPF35280.1 hypothetical protein C5E05_12945 [Pseudoclavibacter sp. AY1H1]PPF78063.1 hypothetical protein C5B99_01795 [Pseudoclavibacter sp. Z016]